MGDFAVCHAGDQDCDTAAVLSVTPPRVCKQDASGWWQVIITEWHLKKTFVSEENRSRKYDLPGTQDEPGV
jgi:hypothetical protein